MSYNYIIDICVQLYNRFGSLNSNNMMRNRHSTFKMSHISNITNSKDPNDINARIFVGNLNTFILNKVDVESIFQRYGNIEAISLHKGFAFVQYTSEKDARSAVTGEDQRIYAGQKIGNIVV